MIEPATKKDSGISSILNIILEKERFKNTVYTSFTFNIGAGLVQSEHGITPMIILKPVIESSNKEYSIAFPMPIANNPIFPVVFSSIHMMISKIDNHIKPRQTKKGLDEVYDLIYDSLDDIIRVITIAHPEVHIKRDDMIKEMKTTYIRSCLGPDKILDAVFDTIRGLEMEEENKSSSIIEIYKK